MAKSAFGIAITDVDTSAKMPLGFRVVMPATSEGDYADTGEREWIYVYNDEAATAFAVGDIVVRDTDAGSTYDAILMASGVAVPAIRVMGVAQHVIADGSYGFVLRRGVGLVKNGTANISDDTPITAGGDRAGAAIDFAAGFEEGIIGTSLEAEANNNTTFDAYINCVG